MTNWLSGTLFVAGLCLAGSDGSWFPWPNAAGWLFFVTAAVILFLTEEKL